MIRLSLVLLMIVLLAAGGAWLADHPGQVSIEFQSWQIDTSFAAIILVSVGLAAGVWMLAWLFEWGKRELPGVGSARVIRKQSKGLKLLNQSLVALSAGDVRGARQQIGQAELLLPAQPMVHLLAAEIATRLGDEKEAHRRYEALKEMDEGRLLGLRGLLDEARGRGKSAEALMLARQALDEDGKSPWALKTVFSLEVAAGEWAAAQKTYGKIAKAGLVDKEQAAHDSAALHYALAGEARLSGQATEARQGYQQALKASAGFLPAILALVQMEKADNKQTAAEKLLKKAWAHEPHPAIVRELDALNPSRNQKEWLKSVEQLVKSNPDVPLSRLTLAQAYMRADQRVAAKSSLEDLLLSAPTRSVYDSLISLLEQDGDNADQLRVDREKAPKDPVWQCQSCGTDYDQWQLICDSCHEFNRLKWGDTVQRQPVVERHKVDAPISMLLEEKSG